ncbi:MAG: hypothetical protein HRU17_00485 [Polyangiaceae bacterium]|nr:hypothetical protein [Polyangiaceae bacterium]
MRLPDMPKPSPLAAIAGGGGTGPRSAGTLASACSPANDEAVGDDEAGTDDGSADIGSEKDCTPGICAGPVDEPAASDDGGTDPGAGAPGSAP